MRQSQVTTTSRGPALAHGRARDGSHETGARRAEALRVRRRAHLRRGIALLGGIAGLGLGGGAWLSSPAAVSAEQSARRTPIVRAVERVAPATVSITTTMIVQPRNPLSADPFWQEFFDQFPGFEEKEETTLGSGTIIDPEQGYVLTNEHVLAAADEIRVQLLDGREFAGELVGADPETDLAVVRIQSDEPLPAAPLAADSDLLIGETVIAIGNPYGLNHSVTTGVLSAVNRSFRAGESDYHGFLQTDASINPGNSGGPLINLDGEVIGINTAIFRDAQGIGFAIPMDRARRIMDDLIRDGQVIPVWLGVRLQDLTPQLQRGLGSSSTTGAVVRDVFAGSPADRAGIQRGDVITELDGSLVQSSRNYYEILRGVTQGDRIGIRLDRGGEAAGRQLVAEVFTEKTAEQLGALMLGVTVEPLAGSSPGAGGLRVVHVLPRSPAAEVGLQPNDLILQIDLQRVTDLSSYRDAINRLQSRNKALIRVQYEGQLEWVELTLP